MFKLDKEVTRIHPVKKRLAATVAVIVVVWAIYTVYQHLPVTIDKAFPAIEYLEGDPSSAAKTFITIKGTLSKPLFRKHKFNGRLVIEHYDFTKTHDIVDMKFKGLNDNQTLLVYTAVSKDGSPDLILFGYIEQANNFEHLYISRNPMLDMGEKAGMMHHIAGPANDFETAASISSSFSK
ncbi:hypothetical protein D3P07_03135 [Paenibacillus sp. 1011MAR3C5]|uniref:hypothetical protein n=1 Tax=Paenibacillus sp. 1011MAR3C5 TaxID=1675787 RepID=UPI000E6B5758|nr:hypothetical protein [Paenibacillus sp. 1011MAR3C5]RJE91078.1 hypothetical protein D3P07_03135 [Paenibacillus sp. 1011MAR3C5]